jgi:6-phosphogluconolactonase (cycloisomerase 2 family)
VHVYDIGDDPTNLTYLNTAVLKSAGPNHLSLDEDTGVVVVSNYCSGSSGAH